MLQDILTGHICCIVWLLYCICTYLWLALQN